MFKVFIVYPIFVFLKKISFPLVSGINKTRIFNGSDNRMNKQRSEQISINLLIFFNRTPYFLTDKTQTLRLIYKNNSLKLSIHFVTNVISQDGRAVQGAAFRSQSSSLGVGSNPTSDKHVIFNLLHFVIPCAQTSAVNH